MINKNKMNDNYMTAYTPLEIIIILIEKLPKECFVNKNKLCNLVFKTRKN